MMICTIGPNLLDLPRNYSHSIRSGSDMIIGLTGGIASGKSTAAKFLASAGAQVMDGDFLGHRAYEPNTTAFSKIVETFGNDIVGGDGQIDRKVLGGKVFGNSDALKQLTDILWPEIRRMFSEWISNGKDNNPNALMVMDAAVLLEAGWEDLADDGLNADAVQKRIASQLTNEERSARADIVIDNSDSEEAFLIRLRDELKRVTTATN